MIKETFINKEYLKELLFHNLLGLFKKHSQEEDENFVFQFSDDRKNIIFSATIQTVYGASCYEEDKQKTKDLAANTFNYYEISEFINNFVLSEDKVNTKDKIDYYNELKTYFDGYEETKEVNEDYYYNHEVVRTYNIPINEIADYLLNFKFTKPIDQFMESMKYTTPNEIKKIHSTMIMENLEKKLPMKQSSQIKNKI